MDRVVLTDDSGRWFDEDAATVFLEASRWDGSNHLSGATGSRWAHEALYLTRSGVWVLHAWSQESGRLPSYVEISEAEAVSWLVKQGHGEDPSDLPESVRLRVVAAMGSLEL